MVLGPHVTAQAGTAAPARPSDTPMETMDAQRRAGVAPRLASTPPCDALLCSDTTCGARKLRLQTSR
ncbi:hypothetical protein WJ01_15445 [Burkholderia vietnamiensis]|nr:hypothetical protein WJ01_15445 [Burkholderia vietnamiensis]